MVRPGKRCPPIRRPRNNAPHPALACRRARRRCASELCQSDQERFCGQSPRTFARSAFRSNVPARSSRSLNRRSACRDQNPIPARACSESHSQRRQAERNWSHAQFVPNETSGRSSCRGPIRPCVEAIDGWLCLAGAVPGRGKTSPPARCSGAEMLLYPASVCRLRSTSSPRRP